MIRRRRPTDDLVELLAVIQDESVYLRGEGIVCLAVGLRKDART